MLDINLGRSKGKDSKYLSKPYKCPIVLVPAVDAHKVRAGVNLAEGSIGGKGTLFVKFEKDREPGQRVAPSLRPVAPSYPERG